MASFNLGYIKGSKGDQGPKGDKGDQGVAGDRGPKGSDGVTPLFEVGAVVTLDSASDASVEIDASIPETPIINFYIPRGKDGKDAYGDMTAAVYDKNGRHEDFFSYADKLFEKTVQKEGAVMLGKIVAAEGVLSEKCVRNIIFAESLPETGANGDLCFVISKSNGKALSECEIGSELLLDEDDRKAEYIVAAKNYYKQSEVTLVRKHVYKELQYFAYGRRKCYSGSDVDIFLEAMFSKKFSANIQKNLKSVLLEDECRRHCYLPSANDIESIEYFIRGGVISSYEDELSGRKYLLRNIKDSISARAIDGSGSYITVDQSEKIACRPMINLPGDMYVVNGIYDGKAVTLPMEETRKLYMYKEGGWRELICDGNN